VERRGAFIFLCLVLALGTGLFGAPLGLSGPVRWGVAGLLLASVVLAGWKAGLDPTGGDRGMAAAALLISPVALFGLMPGFGPPEFADHAHNAFRYVVLLVDSVAIFGGAMLLQDGLGMGSQGLWARLGFWLIAAATPLYLVWAALLLESHRAALAGSVWASGPWNNWLMSLADILLFFGGLFTYLATALFAGALRRAGRIGGRAAFAFQAFSLLAVVCLVLRGIDFPDPASVFATGYAIPGWIAGIPAVPWLMLCIIGLIQLGRPADAFNATAALGSAGE
jgi:hypothetical protein